MLDRSKAIRAIGPDHTPEEAQCRSIGVRSLFGDQTTLMPELMPNMLQRRRGFAAFAGNRLEVLVTFRFGRHS